MAPALIEARSGDAHCLGVRVDGEGEAAVEVGRPGDHPHADGTRLWRVAGDPGGEGVASACDQERVTYAWSSDRSGLRNVATCATWTGVAGAAPAGDGGDPLGFAQAASSVAQPEAEGIPRRQPNLRALLPAQLAPCT